jgi:hypothetical protein
MYPVSLNWCMDLATWALERTCIQQQIWYWLWKFSLRQG